MGYNNNEEPAFPAHKEEQWNYEDNPNDNVKKN